MNTAEISPVNNEWPETELISVPLCPVCGNSERQILHRNLEDIVFKCAPGRWTMWKCQKCGSAWLDPQPSPDSIEKAYEKYYTHTSKNRKKKPYDSLSTFGKLKRKLSNGYLRYAFGIDAKPSFSVGILLAMTPYGKKMKHKYRHLPRIDKTGSNPARVLDIGCGNGRFLELAEQCGWMAEGIDPDPAAVQQAKEKGVTVFCGDLNLYEGQEEIFDYITLNHVIEHVHDPVEVLRSCYRLLKPGGKIWLQTPNIDSLVHMRFGRHWRGLEVPRHLVMFTPDSLHQALQKSGFHNTRMLHYRSPLISMYRISYLLSKEDINSTYKNIKLPYKEILIMKIIRIIEYFWRQRVEFISMMGEKK